jgi:PhnB protein
MSDPTGPGVSVQVQLSVRRGSEAVAFYEHAFGATEAYRVDNDAEVVAQLAVGTTMFWVEDGSPEHHNYSPETLGGATERLLLVVDDPKVVVEQAIAAGAREVYPVQEAHGWLLGRVVDPFGHHWEIGKPLSPWPPPPDEREANR